VKKAQKDNLKLTDGSRIAVVGGGPSGSFFSYFSLELADRFGLDINIDIIEAKDFNLCGPSGCNHCGGIVSESLIQLLSAEGIVLPSKVIKQGIESYTLHLEQGSAVITAPFQEQRIAALFRGGGPEGCVADINSSFDNHLLKLSESKGAKIINERVISLERKEEGILINLKNGDSKLYDLVVGAVGLNKRTFSLFNELCPEFVTPQTTKTFISEIKLSEEQIAEYFGDSMHVFLLNIPNIKFGALIPKQNYVTLVLLGADIDKAVVQKFLQSKAVIGCFPPGTDMEKVITCQCYPFINVKGAKLAHADRVVLVGDSSTSKLYKNGIGAAYVTAKAAANTAIFHGISESDFQQHFQPACRKLQNDNRLGKIIFAITSIIQKSAILKTAMLNVVIMEQKMPRQKRKMSSVLWDTFTGSAPYNSIFYRFLHPRVIAYLLWFSLKAVFTTLKSR
jgi:flavin-dependent dehydrogenase